MPIATHVPTIADPQSTVARRTGSLRRTTVVSGFVAAVAATGAAAASDAAGVAFEVDGDAIPLAGFAQMTLLSAVIGGVLLAVLNRCSRSPRLRFVQATVALTALSCVPSAVWPDTAAAKIVLVGLHVLAAVIVVPALLRHACD